MVPSIFLWRQPRCFSVLPAAVLFQEALFFVWNFLMLFFQIPSPLIWWCQIPIFLVYFLSIWLIAIPAITNSNGDSTCPSNKPLLSFTSAELIPPAVNPTLHVPMILTISQICNTLCISWVCDWVVSNSNDENASPWKIPFWIFSSAKHSPRVVTSTSSPD